MISTEEIFNLLQKTFGDKIIELNQLNKELIGEEIIIINPLCAKEICNFIKEDEQLKFDSLMNLSGVDEGKDNENLSVYYHLYSMKNKNKLTLKTLTPKENPEVTSVSEVWKCADWHEREAYDLVGINFLEHKDLRRILLPDDWEGHPLRKDYQIPEFYNDMKVID